MQRSLRSQTGARVLAAAVTLAVTAITAITAASAVGAAHRTAAKSAGPVGNAVTVTRDGAGVAHIVASNFTALGYGEGNAFAQDNLCTFANDIVTVEGDRSQYFGPKGLAVNYSAGVDSTNLDSDLFWRYVQATGLVQRDLTATGTNGLLPQVRQLYTGWVDGYNALPALRQVARPQLQGQALGAPDHAGRHDPAR